MANTTQRTTTTSRFVDGFCRLGLVLHVADGRVHVGKLLRDLLDGGLCPLALNAWATKPFERSPVDGGKGTLVNSRAPLPRNDGRILVVKKDLNRVARAHHTCLHPAAAGAVSGGRRQAQAGAGRRIPPGAREG